MSNKYFIGIDGGGTKCLAVLVDNNRRVLGEGRVPSINPTFDIEAAKEAIEVSASIALTESKSNGQLPSDINLSDIPAGLGFAGAGVAKVYNELSDWNGPFKSHLVFTDIKAACIGAHENNDGIALIVGTGTCGYSLKNNKSVVLGGHGFPQGDVGGGAWFGLKAVKSALMFLDGVTRPSLMDHLLLESAGVVNSSSLVDIIASKPSSVFAEYANVVFEAAEQTDLSALKIIHDGVCYLEKIICKLDYECKLPVCLIGGLSEKLRPYFSEKVKSRFIQPIHSPQVGSAIYIQDSLNSR